MKRFFSMMLLCAVVMLASCSKDEDETVAVAGISLDKASLSLVVGETGTLVATINPDNATNKNVQWSSSDKNVATVSADGIVTAKVVGSATITATVGTQTATCEVTVKALTPYGWYKDNKTASSFEISTVVELKAFANLVNGTDQANSGESEAVDFAGKTVTLKVSTAFDLNNEEWTPIGSSKAFKGTFDGNNNSVSGLKVSSGQKIGLFGYVLNGVLKNLKIDGGVVSGAANSFAGGLVGYSDASTIENCGSSATVSGETAGGVIGCAGLSSINACYASGNVTAIETNTKDVSAGGIVGDFFQSGNIRACYYMKGTVTGGKTSKSSFTGGIIGFSDSSVEVSNCYSTGSVVAGTAKIIVYTGGIIGYSRFSENLSNLLYVSGKGALSGIGERGTDTASVKGIPSVDKLSENISWLNTNLPGEIGWLFNTDGTLKKAN